MLMLLSLLSLVKRCQYYISVDAIVAAAACQEAEASLEETCQA